MAFFLLLLAMVTTISRVFTANMRGISGMGTYGQDNNEGFRIINGDEAESCNQFPWMAHLYTGWQSGHFYSVCGASIVSDKWLLTAAHCTIKQDGRGTKPPPSALTVRTGSVDSDSGIRRTVDKIIEHPNYRQRNQQYDIALLRLATPIKWDSCNAPIALNTNKNVDDSTTLTCLISGWGKSSVIYDHRPTHLLWAYDRILSRKECDRIYKGHSTDNTLCGRATSKGSEGFCSGDSGGPLVCKSKQDGLFYQHGVVSVYLKSKMCQMEGLYSNVAAVHEWITENIK